MMVPMSEEEVEVEFLRMLDTDLVVPIIPSPIMMRVRRPMRSTWEGTL